MVVPNHNGVSDCRTVTDCRFLELRKSDCVPLGTRAMKHVSLLESFKTKYDEQRAESQTTLREFVTCPEIDLDKRFEVWSKWCEKKKHPWIIHERDAGIFGKAVDDCLHEFNRYRRYTWRDMLEILSEAWNREKDGYIYTEEEVKEALIDTNFGSFYMDW